MGEVIPSIMLKAPMRQADQTGPRADAKRPAGDFAAQLREQLSVKRNPGPGSDAGKGGAAGESAAQPTDARPKDEQGQTAGPGRETGEERLALQALLAGAQMTTASAATELTAVTAASAQPATSPAAASAAAASATTAARTASANAAQPATPAEPAPGKASGSTGATPAVPATPSAQAAAAALAAQSRVTTAVAQPDNSQAQSAKQQTPPATTTAQVTAEAATTQAATAQTATATTTESSAATATTEAVVGATAAEATATTQTTEAAKTDSDAGSAVSKAARGKSNRLASANEADTAPADETTTSPATASNPAVTKARSNSAPEQPTRARVAATKAAADKPNPVRADDATDALSVRPQAVTTGETVPVTTTRTIGVGRNPVDPTMAKSVIDQIAAKASVNPEGELTQLSLQLHPETLGRVNLRLSMAGGVLSAKVMVDNPAVKAALEANLADLRQSLADQGIALQGMSVALGGQGQQHEYRDYREAASQAAEAPGRIRSAAVRQNPSATPVRSHGAGHRLDVIV